MKRKAIFCSAALIAMICSSGAFAQTVPATRTAPIRIGTVPAPKPANTVSGEGRTAAMIDELQKQIDQLETELAKTRNEIAAMQNAMKTASAKGEATASANTSAIKSLSQSYFAHDHHQNWLSVQSAGDGGGVNSQVSTMTTSPPTSTCTSKPAKTGNTWSGRYDCVAPK